MGNVRCSNIESLRIVAMLMIVTHHVLVHGIIPVDNANGIIPILDVFVIYGVNIFLLISGYFGIRLTWKSFFNLMWIIAFYKICHLFIDTVIFGVNHTIYEWLLKPISGVVSGGGWFVDVYILLMLVSPLLNRLLVVVKGIHEYLQYLLVLLLLDIGYGFVLGKHFDAYGYSLMHFIVMYFVGYGIRHYVNVSKVFCLTFLGGCFIVYLCCVLLFYGVQWNVFYSYSSPFVVTVSCFIFVFFVKTGFYVNKIINYVASSMLPVYLIHEGGYTSKWYYDIIGNYWNATNGVKCIGMILLLILFPFVIAISLDQIRRLCATPIVRLLSSGMVKLEDYFREFIK